MTRATEARSSSAAVAHGRQMLANVGVVHLRGVPLIEKVLRNLAPRGWRARRAACRNLRVGKFQFPTRHRRDGTAMALLASQDRHC